ncbi:MAG: HAMP domain-containing protein [Acidimicrobiia bacterium]|nr:HAMP domain-containing protein [Acidimicrobiia bacterium]MYG57395.1 HAMP domain-containing protein [Acidimicrobiia bacterium]MYJ31846.1 HAMP domain-containing protein [Acidimicrobiia bacterium]
MTESIAPEFPETNSSTAGAQRPAIHRRISTQLYAGIFGAVVLTIVASVVSWISFNNVNSSQKRVSEESVPELAGAFTLAEFSNALVAAAPRLTTAPPTQFSEISAEVTVAQQEFQERFESLLQENPDDVHVQGIAEAADALERNITTITADMPHFYSLSRRIEVLQVQIPSLHDQVEGIIIPAIDDQLFFQVTGYRDFDTEPTDAMSRTSGDELLLYRHLNALQADMAQVTELMGSALIASEADFVEPLIESFESTTDRIQISLSAIAASGIAPGLGSAIDRLLALGDGNDSAFRVSVDRLDIIERQDSLLAQNQEIAIDLLDEVNALVQNAQAGADQATENSAQTINTARILLVIISVIGVIGAGLISWLFVGRVLLRRIGRLSGRMRTLAKGDLEEEIDVVGRDEIAEMASALEVFRRHALEIQRLNLVEQLAQELSERNDELQEVLEELSQAQDQIVAREKLAALGEVTAGVAHEIRNPLNFINNFSAASVELLEEMAEIYAELTDNLSDDDKDLIEEINQDLNDNLERIQSHGKRANRIVQDMLQMGRGGGETQMTDINDLIHEHSLLAFHSARAQDPDFIVTLEEEFDPDMGQLEIVPQDLGRVFLNFVANAGYATNKRQRELAEAGTVGDYRPTILLKSRRTDESAILSVRDNGNGIPPDVAAKIFDPFFTTKPTNEGTGLGLALSADIVREHGGTITVNTEPGEFTEMVVELPLTRAKSTPLVGDGDDTGDDDT